MRDDAFRNLGHKDLATETEMTGQQFRVKCILYCNQLKHMRIRANDLSRAEARTPMVREHSKW